MKTTLFSIISAGLMCLSQVWSQTYTNYIRQVQYPSGVQLDATGLAAAGSQESQLAIDPGGARFELWTVSSVGPTSYLLSSSYVGTYIPIATVAIRSEDTTSPIPRTRADRPFYVDLTVSGLRSGINDPEASKSVKFLRHLQSYGVGGTGIGIDRTQATLQTSSEIKLNGTQNYTYLLTLVPSADRSKVRGEERFSVYSLEDKRNDYKAPELELASKFIQIWPVADGSISGIAQNQLLRYSLPKVTLTLNDLYPNSTTYAQVYKGNPVLGTVGKIVPGSSLIVNDSIPQNRVLVLDDYASVLEEDGRWTLELLTKTPFGTDRLSFVTFDLDRTMKMNGSFTSLE